MSVPPKGNYSQFVLYDEEKRYYIMQAQKNKPLLDAEIREMNNNLLTLSRRFIQGQLGDIGSPSEPYSTPPATGGVNNALKIVESGSNSTNNFTITGGSGLEDPAVIYYKGFYIFYKGNVEYEDLNDALGVSETNEEALKRDNYTKSNIPTLSTPGLARTDVVYVDLSFAEVTSDTTLGSEYEDSEIRDQSIGAHTSNRLRAVFDVKVYETWTGSTGSDIFDDAFFGHQIEDQIDHYKFPIAVLNREAGNPLVTDAMISDLMGLHDKRVYTAKELTHRTRHGGFTQNDVDAGRASASDLDETAGATGLNEGFDTEALNTDSVSPRVLDNDGKFKISSLVVAGATGPDVITSDPEDLVDGEAVMGTALPTRIVAGYQGGITGSRDSVDVVVIDASGETGAGLAVLTTGDTGSSAMQVKDGFTGAPKFEIKAGGKVGIKTGVTGPIKDFDVAGTGNFDGDVTMMQDLYVKEDILADGLIIGDDYVIPKDQLTPTNPAVFGIDYPGVAGSFATVQSDLGFAGQGATGFYGSFQGFNDSGTQGFSIGRGNSVARRAVIRPKTATELRVTANSATDLSLVDGIEFDEFDNLFAVLEIDSSAGAVVYINKDTGAVTSLVTGIQRADQIAYAGSGVFYVTSEVSGASTTDRIYQVTVTYDGSNIPTSAIASSLTTDVAIDNPEGIIVLPSSFGVANAGDLVVAEDVNPGRILLINPGTGTTSVLLSGLNRPEGLTYGQLGVSAAAIYATITGDDQVLRIDTSFLATVLGDPTSVTLTEPDNVFLAQDGMLYVTEDRSSGASRVIRINDLEVYEVFITGLSAAAGLATSSKRALYIAEQDTQTVYDVPLPSAFLAHMDSDVVGDTDFPGYKVKIGEFKEVAFEGGDADLFSFFEKTRFMDDVCIAGDTYVGSDLFVDGVLHADGFDIGEFLATSIGIGTTDACNALDVWGNAGITCRMIIGLDPCSSEAQLLFGSGGTLGSTTGSTTGSTICDSEGTLLYVFGDIQAEDYVAMGETGAFGIFAVEDASGTMGGWLGGDSNTGNEIGMHLIDVENFVFDKNGGVDDMNVCIEGNLKVRDNAFIGTQVSIGSTGGSTPLYVAGDAQVVGNLTVDSISYSSGGPGSSGEIQANIQVNVDGVESSDLDQGVSWKKFALTTETSFGITGVLGVTDEDLGNTNEGLRGVASNWEVVTTSPLGVTGTSSPIETNPTGSLDRVVIQKLGNLQISWYGQKTEITPSSADPATIIQSYSVSSTFLGDSVNWIAARSDSNKLVRTRASLIERFVDNKFADMHDIDAALHVFIPLESWSVDLERDGTKSHFRLKYEYENVKPDGTTQGDDKGPRSYVNINTFNRSNDVQDAPLNPLDLGDVGVTGPAFNYEQTPKNTPEGGWKLAIVPAYQPSTISTSPLGGGANGDFMYTAQWELELVAFPTSSKTCSNFIGEVSVSAIS